MKTFILVISIMCMTNICFAQLKKESKPILTDHHYKFIPNNASIWFSNNGDMSFNPETNAAGWEWPKGSGKHVGFESGLVYGGKVNGKLHVGGSSYRHGLQGGSIKPNGKPADRTDSMYRIYHITDYDEQTGMNPDYNFWPIKDGAPTDEYGKPALYGDEQIWFVSNDLDTTRTKYLFGTDPIGLEIQTTAWAFNTNTHFDDVVYVKHLIINKSNFDLTDTYVGLWSDFDLGDANDDYYGVDTIIQLSYVYNGYEKDAVYGINPPAAGILFCQTPRIPSTKNDSTLFNMKMRRGFSYVPLSGYSFYYNCSGVYRDPAFGVTSGATDLYSNLQGLLWTGQSYIDITTGKPTKFCLAGDPITKKGWNDGVPAPPGDRRSLIAAGPFTLAKGDTQEVAYAMLAAQGLSRLGSVQKLKYLAQSVKTFYPSNYEKIVIPPQQKYDFYIGQNYPNPFGETSLSGNGNTTINYSIPVPTHVRITVINFLGQIIATLIDNAHSEGNYSVKWDANNAVSGIYFYQFEALGYSIRKKMIVVQ